MLNKVLIANRGEIAVRIIRACRELGIRCVAVYSTADRRALHVQLADEAICIGGPAAKDSYLKADALLTACKLTGCDALHPGFGFLSEDAEFAQQCADCGVTFIGPTPEAISLLGDKARAKQTMIAAGVPVVPGSDGTVHTPEEAKKIAEKIGYPLLIKAAAGGGGRGIRPVFKPEELESQMLAASAEAKACFGSDALYMERYLQNPKHVEVQIIADQLGNVVHLGERDCSMQRRNQKLLEESPCPILNDTLRDQMGQAAVRAAKQCGFVSAGTVEFLTDGKEFFFMEMNTRIQVEHPVTESVTGVDLVQAQLRIAAGEPLGLTQDDIALRGHSIECRVLAENPSLGFRPCAGTIQSFHAPGGPGIRIDSAIYQGCDVPPFYDSMLAKVIVHAPTREQAIAKMRWALAEFIVEGIDTNIDLQLSLIKTDQFLSGDYNTGTLTALGITEPKKEG